MINQTINKLERKGFEGSDASLETSLGEYGFAWKLNKKTSEYLIIYRNEVNKFGYAHWDTKTDFLQEYDWVDWDSFLSYLGETGLDSWTENNDPMTKLGDLFRYYGPLEIFGSDYSGGFTIKGVE